MPPAGMDWRSRATRRRLDHRRGIETLRALSGWRRAGAAVQNGSHEQNAVTCRWEGGDGANVGDHEIGEFVAGVKVKGAVKGK